MVVYSLACSPAGQQLARAWALVGVKIVVAPSVGRIVASAASLVAVARTRPVVAASAVADGVVDGAPAGVAAAAAAAAVVVVAVVGASSEIVPFVAGFETDERILVAAAAVVLSLVTWDS